MITTQTIENTENRELSTHPVKPVAKSIPPQRNASIKPMQQIDRFLGIEDRCDRVRINGRTHKTTRMKLSWPRPKHETKIITSSLKNCT